ncbi:PREDICTED: uncharacterized protein LOC104708697 [Camelina sativa]|uniref:Uncharacterized protein LOC104708697 n=1 Tax=Camelina sativa TaxID=90675 RepID=A0ABM1QCN6_CAMSA|nr:PREDICTED: uncharacterized protein LOC104708697 [Camelina sativa]XP_019084524.1 PREDICTED: uncharacterized protein LOC104708697 [Camelina sativa]
MVPPKLKPKADTPKLKPKADTTKLKPEADTTKLKPKADTSKLKPKAAATKLKPKVAEPSPPSPNGEGGRDRKYFSFRDEKPKLLLEVLKQSSTECYATATTRQLDALCRSEGLLGDEESLSIQEILDLMPRGTISDGGLDQLDALKGVFKIGTVLESANPLTFRYSATAKLPTPNVKMFKAKLTRQRNDDYPETKKTKYTVETGEEDLFEKLLEDSVRLLPTAVRVDCVHSVFDNIKGKQVYLPPESCDEEYGHMLLITVFGIDASFW